MIKCNELFTAAIEACVARILQMSGKKVDEKSIRVQGFLPTLSPWPQREMLRVLKILIGRCSLDFRASILEDANAVAMNYTFSLHDYAKLHEIIKTFDLFDTATVSEPALKNLRNNLQPDNERVSSKTKNLVVHLILRAYERSGLAQKALGTTRTKIQKHVQDRFCQESCFFTSLGEDLIERVAQLAGYRAACCLLRTNKDFSADPRLKGMIPRIQIRKIHGTFPHKVQFISGIGVVPVVCKSNLVGVVLDLAVDGVAVKGHDSKTVKHRGLNRGWDSNIHNMTKSMLSHRVRDIEQLNQRSFSEGVVADGKINTRLSAKLFFDDELSCKVELVYADSHLPVDARVCEPLRIPRAYRRRLTSLSTYTSQDGVPYPAYCFFHVVKLSTQDAMSLYKFKVTAVGVVKNTTPPKSKTFVTFSEAFASLSTKRERASGR